MINFPFSRLLLAVALASSFAMTACDVRTDADKPPTSEAQAPITSAPDNAFPEGTHPIFNVGAAQLPLVTDLPFLAAASALGANFDGTALVADASDTVRTAVNDLDGWSTNAYFDVSFSGSLDPASVHGPGGADQNVFLVKLNTGSGDPLDPASIVVASPVAAVLTSSDFSVSVQSLNLGAGTVSNNTIRIVPKKPLSSASKYLVFITNTIQDEGAAAITESSNYHSLTETNGPFISAQLQGVSDWLDGTKTISANLISALSGSVISPTDARLMVALSYTFTTTDPRKPLVAMAAPRGALFASGVSNTDAATLEGLGLLPTPKARTLAINPATATDLSTLTSGALAASVANLYTGYITLPYYQATGAPDFSHLVKMWRADLTLAGALGKTVPQDSSQTGSDAPVADGTTNVTWRYPFAAATGTETIPLQVTLPVGSYTSAALGGATCAQVEAAQNGYPVAIYIHGITSDRTSVIALAHALAKACIATVAIDLPMHGIDSNSPYKGSLNVDHGSVGAAYAAVPALHERHFDQTLNSLSISCPTGANPPVPATMDFSTAHCYDKSGSLFINLSNLQNTRDNLKEGVQDLLNLNASLATISALNLDGDATTNDLNLGKVYVIGVSLGGMVGTTFATVNQLAIAQEAGAGFASNLNPIKGLLVSAGGTQLTQILINSPTFGPVISDGLTLAGAGVGTANRESFLNVAQATVDAADPVNFAGVLGSGALTGDGLNVPTLVQMIVGGGNTNIAELGNDTTTWITDQVVPNSVVGAPLAGTLPLAGLLAAGPTADGTSNSAALTNKLAQLTIGYHSSLLIPNAAAPTGPWTGGEQLATGELQTEAVTFVLTGAAAFHVGTVDGMATTDLSSNYTTP